METEGLRYWMSVDPAKDSDVIYKVTLPNRMLSSTWHSNSSIEYDTKSEYLRLLASDNTAVFQQVDFASFPTAFQNLTQDTSNASQDSLSVLLKAEWKGELVRYMVSDELNQQYASFSTSTVPEPAAISLAIAVIVCGPFIRRR